MTFSREIYEFFKIAETAATLLKRDSNTDVFLWTLQNFLERLLKNICKRLLLNQLAILKNTSEQLLLTLLLNSKNLLPSYEQLSYYQFNVT